jgi:TolA-binding protein
MRWLFSGRNAKLETMNRILTDAARKRTERIEELEDQLAQLECRVAHLKQELETARKAIERVSELEVVATQRAHLLNEKDKELAAIREAVTQRANLLNEKDKELAVVREAAAARFLRIQELERTLAQIGRK